MASLSKTTALAAAAFAAAIAAAGMAAAGDGGDGGGGGGGGAEPTIIFPPATPSNPRPFPIVLPRLPPPQLPGVSPQDFGRDLAGS
jgi:hypothetical protein